MKSYSIGRDESSNIIVNDPTQMVSRHHATLNIDGRKMTIVDSSTNGTYINGIRISSGTPVPVTRRDVISFAQVSELDWKCVPNESRKNIGIISAVLAAILVIGGGSYYFLSKDNEHKITKQEGEESAWAQLGEKIETMKKDVSAIVADYKTVSDTLKVMKESLETKDLTEKTATAKAEEVKKIFWQMEEAVKNVDPESIQKSLDSVVQSYEDKVSSTESRAAELEKRVKNDKEVLDDALKKAKQAAETIASLKAKAKPQPKKEPEKKQDDNKEVIIVG
ncbi:MAG: FHA domain-containing protein [Bacteroidales bacterium]|nr:FHA domain-containing protein [Bacteroidales bacterium]